MQSIVTKDDGTRELFDEEKIRQSMLNVGADNAAIEHALKNINKNLIEYMPSGKIYSIAVRTLQKHQPVTAIKYTLKRAMLDLGPDGYVFERFMAKVLAAHGYKTRVSTFVKGFCVEHEVDIIAEKNSSHIMIECKYHNNPGIKSDIKTALYVNARYHDLKKAGKTGKSDYDFSEGWLATNTKCSSQAIRYAECSGMGIVAWHYPGQKNLEYYIDSKKIYPVSILPGLRIHHKIKLFEKEIYTIQDLLENVPDAIMGYLGISPETTEKVFEDAAMLFT